MTSIFIASGRRRLALGLALAAWGCGGGPSAPGPSGGISGGDLGGTGGAAAGATGTGGASGSGVTGGSGGMGASTGGVTPPDADTTPDSAVAVDAEGPAGAAPEAGTATGGTGGGAPGDILFELKDPLPALSTAETSGDISWFDDPTEGKVVRIRALDGGNAIKERAEVSFGQGILKNGETIYVGWRAKLELANPDQAWRNIFQEKSHGTYQENVPFCMRADTNTLRMLDAGFNSIWTHPIILNTWFTVFMKIFYGTGKTGTVELWINGEAQKFNDGTTVAHLGTWGGGLQDVHFGIYRRVTVMGTDAHYISHLRVATTPEAARPPM
jgi:hypothetical protein